MLNDDQWHHVRTLTDTMHDLDVEIAGVVTDYVGIEYARGDGEHDFKIQVNPISNLEDVTPVETTRGSRSLNLVVDN